MSSIKYEYPALASSYQYIVIDSDGLENRAIGYKLRGVGPDSDLTPDTVKRILGSVDIQFFHRQDGNLILFGNLSAFSPPYRGINSAVSSYCPRNIRGPIIVCHPSAFDMSLNNNLEVDMSKLELKDA